ncbi:MAG: alpha-amylase/4-alpha-glucanotransferase domain-containing protein [Sulfurovum sp.]|uniref:alpha-amylase/4-alpha-glucanotransferase domain-containing protein n=1 Tax=Sulfurovum sp. TaxID=1969726 RepID=UPI003C73C9B0
MANTTKLLFGIHMHQPVDNFDWVIEHGVEVCYGPFFEVMSKYPEFRFSVHCSGWLMEQIEELHPKLYKQIKTLAKKGSIEFFSAGYYEPILSVIPSEDRVEQINMLNDAISSDLNQVPKGLWLTERVWESSLIPDLSDAGIKYTVMDDYHFQCAGFDEDILDGYYMSEEGGKEIGLFPISKKLRYAIPFLNVDSAIKAIKSFDRKENSAAIIFDDAEKFGMWPGTHEWVYEKGWLDTFVQAVLADETIDTMHYGEYFEQERTRGIAYLPNVSYYEMGEWSLRAEDTLKLEALKKEMGHERYEKEGVKFLKGGIWKNFLVKYEESNRIHKRTLELSKARKRVKKHTFDEALYKAQTNDALWHGVFGGLYLPNLRDNAYTYIIEAENVRYGKKSILVSDQNELDGHQKVKAVTAKHIFRFDGAHGGQLVEFDLRKACFNWQNTLTRRKEAYHQRLLNPEQEKEIVPAEEGIDTIHHASMEVDDTILDAIIYDWYLKNSFVDHISDANFNGDNFRYCNFHEFGDFSNQAFEVQLDKNKVTFSRDGGLYFPEKVPTRLEKIYTPSKKGFDFTIDLSTEAKGDFYYVLEHNFHFADYDTITVNGETLSDNKKIEQVCALEIYDGHLKQKINIELDQLCDIYYFQLKTLSQSEHGFDLSVQGISFAMKIPFSNALYMKGSLEVVNV